VVGIGAQEAHGVGAPGHGLEVALLEREQVGRLDAQVVGDVVEILAALLARLAQMAADVDETFGYRIEGRVEIRRSTRHGRIFAPRQKVGGLACDVPSGDHMRPDHSPSASPKSA
jgi:hypothetical protein